MFPRLQLASFAYESLNYKKMKDKLIWRPQWIPMELYACCKNKNSFDKWAFDSMLGRTLIAPKFLRPIKFVYQTILK